MIYRTALIRCEVWTVARRMVRVSSPVWYPGPGPLAVELTPAAECPGEVPAKPPSKGVSSII